MFTATFEEVQDIYLEIFKTSSYQSDDAFNDRIFRLNSIEAKKLYDWSTSDKDDTKLLNLKGTCHAYGIRKIKE